MMAEKKQAQDKDQQKQEQQKQAQTQSQKQELQKTLSGKKVAILVTDGFEQVELTEPRKALDQAGARTSIVSPKADKVRGWKFTEWGDEMKVDVALDKANPDDFDALLLPGGVMNPDSLRIEPKAVEFAAAFFDAGKPVASICHGPWMVIETGAAEGRRIASWPSLRTDLENAGAEWVDEESCVDGNLVTARKPEDIPAFNREMLKLFARSPEELEQEEAETADEESVALFVRLEAKPGKEDEVEEFLRSGLPLVEDEPETTSWYGMRLGDRTFGIFDTFADDSGRQAHLAGRVASAMNERASDLFSQPPVIERVDVLCAKLP
jgi:protease I